LKLARSSGAPGVRASAAAMAAGSRAGLPPYGGAGRIFLLISVMPQSFYGFLLHFSVEPRSFLYRTITV
jgi:hypothetical protein